MSRRTTIIYCSMASGPHDIESSLDGSAVRYKVYPEKKRKSKIKLCVRFDPDDPKPEREWDQFRDDGDPEAAVRAAARRLLGGSAPTESVEAARAASERVAAERQAAADEEAQQLQQWHAEKAVREAEQQAARDAAAAERAARWEKQQAARRERREEAAHAVCAAYHRGLADGMKEVRATLQVLGIAAGPRTMVSARSLKDQWSRPARGRCLQRHFERRDGHASGGAGAQTAAGRAVGSSSQAHADDC